MIQTLAQLCENGAALLFLTNWWLSAWYALQAPTQEEIQAIQQQLEEALDKPVELPHGSDGGRVQRTVKNPQLAVGFFP